MRFFIDSVQGDTADPGAGRRHRGVRDRARRWRTAGQPDPTFTDSGTIAANNPAAGDPTGLQNVFGVTGTEMNTSCTMPPASQGVDGWVSKLPAGFGDGLHTV